jgi:thiamine pyrophosphate-dependent acetolactate synthase large subunit-like protein
MAHGMGVEGVRVEQPEDIGAAVERMLSHAGPFLIDLVLASDSHPARAAARRQSKER